MERITLKNFLVLFIDNYVIYKSVTGIELKKIDCFSTLGLKLKKESIFPHYVLKICHRALQKILLSRPQTTISGKPSLRKNFTFEKVYD